MLPSRGLPSQLLIGLLAGALAISAACRAGRDAGYWKSRRDRPRPYAPVRMSLAWDRPVPFCPEQVVAEPHGSILARSGTRAWELNLDDGEGAPAIVAEEEGGDASVGSDTGVLDRVAAAGDRTAHVLWEGIALFGVPDLGALRAVRAKDGKPLWEIRAGAGVVVAPQLLRGRILFQSLDNYLYCLKAKNGHEVWRARAENRLTRPAVFWRDRALTIPEGSDTVHVFDMFDGSRAGTWTLPAADQRFVTGPAIVGDTLVAAHGTYGSDSCAVAAVVLASDDP